MPVKPSQPASVCVWVCMFATADKSLQPEHVWHDWARLTDKGRERRGEEDMLWGKPELSVLRWFCVFSCSVGYDTCTPVQRRFTLAPVLTGYSVHPCERSKHYRNSFKKWTELNWKWSENTVWWVKVWLYTVNLSFSVGWRKVCCNS